MKTVDITRRAARSLRHAKARTILTSLAIGVGAFTIAISLAAGEGARDYAHKLISSNVNPQALFIVKDKTLFEGGGQQAPIREYDPNVSTNARGISIVQMTQADIDELNTRNDIKSVVPIYNPSVEYMTFGAKDTKFTASVTTYDDSIMTQVSEGTVPASGQQLGDTEAVVPSVYVDTLVKAGAITDAKDLIGKKVTMAAYQATATPSTEEITTAFMTGGQDAVTALLKPKMREFTFTVRAISERSSTALTSMTEIQIAPNAAREISEYTTAGTDKYQKYLGVSAVVADGKDPKAVKDDLVNSKFYAQTAEDLQGVIFTVVNTLQGIVLGFGIVALIASVFGIINTQYISVLERTREIGLMKALGMRGRNVSRLFQFEAAWIGFLGGVIGAAIAVIAGLSLNPWITKTLELGDGNYLLIFNPISIIVMIIALMLVAMLAGWFPARKAAKLDPIVALRTE